MNLGEICSSLYDTLGFQATPDGAVTRKIVREVNRAHRQLLGLKQMSRLRRRTLTFTSVANSEKAVLPQACVRIVTIVDRTNRRILDPVELQQIRFRDPGQTFTSSIPDSYAIENFASPVALDPSAAAQLYVVSDDAGDGTGQTAFIEGIVTGGYPRRANIAMNGLTGVALDSNATWEIITKFYVAAPAKGNITLRQTSGVGTELARITPQRTYARYTRILLGGIPASAITYYADCEIHVYDMLNLSDEPLLPEDFHWLLECGVLMREWLKKEKVNLWKLEAAEWHNGTADLKEYMARLGGVPHGPQRSGRTQPSSQLGAFFPAGS